MMLHMDFRIVLRETEQAIYIWTLDWQKLWLPKSLCDHVPKAGEKNGTVAIPDWFWEKMVHEKEAFQAGRGFGPADETAGGEGIPA